MDTVLTPGVYTHVPRPHIVILYQVGQFVVSVLDTSDVPTYFQEVFTGVFPYRSMLCDQFIIHEPGLVHPPYVPLEIVGQTFESAHQDDLLLLG